MYLEHATPAFPFLFGGTFIEAVPDVEVALRRPNFPSFSEGLSLRPPTLLSFWVTWGFPFLFGGTFIEAAGKDSVELRSADFPSFSEGLSLRPVLQDEAGQWMVTISLPFRRDFH